MERLRKNYFILVVFLLIVMCIIGACGKKENSDEISITSNWKLVSFTVNGEKTEVKDGFDSSLYPTFSCPDGVNCVVSNGKEGHHGTIEEVDGKYMITFDGSSLVGMEGTISGNTLTLVNPKGTVEMVFATEEK